MFRDRVDAGRQLAAALEQFRGVRPLVLGLPRGGVVVAAAIARKLACDLDVLLVKKLRAPDNPELAIGAIAEDGRTCLNAEIMQLTRPSDEYVEAETRKRMAEMADQRRRYRKLKPQLPAADRTLFLVDDGLATGATMIAAAQAIRLANPRKVVVAVPVAPPDTLAYIQSLPQVDEVECLLTPTWFGGVGEFYHDFTEVTDEEVVDILKQFV